MQPLKLEQWNLHTKGSSLDKAGHQKFDQLKMTKRSWSFSFFGRRGIRDSNKAEKVMIKILKLLRIYVLEPFKWKQIL